ncbi:MBL fold metallo-hydrolase [Cytophagaceae bacterium DM2B3-1]|uniref:MBL fold metallo-hydrolase n=1 Tax=Xanthocytophaga flava TaxID=3048013 RepID=A0ABT7CTF9_9BACT|nr:MBL fold metallo-hydrolase [Xanthocytophaga flavus]MDJ1471330.1 MBL fold metallo-hydrolase [Xanthocytophaga flavus]MDJ1496791.1 MBL fold metallo-hydrolase [Xanthocytophaga flavus]
MLIEQIYTGCLAQGAYYIESKGEAAVIDPLREVQPYLQRAKRNGSTIKYIFETHFHADFVSGHLDLAKQTGASIIYGPNANPAFEAIIAKDNQQFQLGELTIRVLHTPGHTLESSCFLLIDSQGNYQAVFTGDTLFIGDVGRPDLAQKSSLTMEDLAGYLYDSLHTKLMPLPDDVIVYPAHGAGSACGKNMSKETSDTLGHQKLVNYALKATNKDQFIKEVTDGLLPPPYYFPQNVQLNKEGYESVEKVVSRGLTPLNADTFELVVNEQHALILDTRKPQVFKDDFIPNSINIGIDGDFAPWVGTLITDINQPIVLVVEAGREEEVVTRLSRVGYDHTLGYLQGGIQAWKEAGKEIDQIESISADEFASRFQNGNLQVKDVRKQSEYEAEHMEGAENVPLAYLSEHMAEFSKAEPVYIHCAGGYRSMIAASILKARGYDNIIDVAGGFKAIAQTNIPKTSYTCPSTL